jgi:hypothetical protein
MDVIMLFVIWAGSFLFLSAIDYFYYHQNMQWIANMVIAWLGTVAAYVISILLM